MILALDEGGNYYCFRLSEHLNLVIFTDLGIVSYAEGIASLCDLV